MSDKMLQGPNNKWSIDAQGNIFLAGRLCVKGWIDPAWLQIPNQGSDVVPANSLLTFGSVFCFRNSSSITKTVSADTVGPYCWAKAFNGSQVLGGTDTTIVTFNFTRSASGNMLVLAGWSGVSDTASIGVPTSKLVAGGSTIVTYSSDVGYGGSGTGKPFGGIMAAVYAAGSGSVAYSLQMNDSGLAGTWTCGNASLAVIEVD